MLDENVFNIDLTCNREALPFFDKAANGYQFVYVCRTFGMSRGAHIAIWIHNRETPQYVKCVYGTGALSIDPESLRSWCDERGHDVAKAGGLFRLLQSNPELGEQYWSEWRETLIPVENEEFERALKLASEIGDGSPQVLSSEGESRVVARDGTHTWEGTTWSGARDVSQKVVELERLGGLVD
jgi:hypothetical protein